MLSFAYLEEEEEIIKKPPSLEKKKLIEITNKKPVVQDETECNLVVMFFVIGVVILAVMDSVKK